MMKMSNVDFVVNLFGMKILLYKVFGLSDTMYPTHRGQGPVLEILHSELRRWETHIVHKKE